MKRYQAKFKYDNEIFISLIDDEHARAAARGLAYRHHMKPFNLMFDFNYIPFNVTGEELTISDERRQILTTQVTHRSRIYISAHGSASGYFGFGDEAAEKKVRVVKFVDQLASCLTDPSLKIQKEQNLRISLLICHSGEKSEAAPASDAMRFHHRIWKKHGIFCSVLGRIGVVNVQGPSEATFLSEKKFHEDYLAKAEEDGISRNLINLYEGSHRFKYTERNFL